MSTAEEIFDSAVEDYKRGDKTSAKNKLDQVCLLDPKHSRGFALRGAILFDNGECFDASLNYDQAIAADPKPEYFNNKATALIELDRWDDGEAWLRKAVVNKPDFAPGWNNLARNLLIKGKLDIAVPAFKAAIRVKSDYADAHIGLAFALLEQGNFADGWAEYEWRKKKLTIREIGDEWSGQNIDDSALLLRSEQGLGDTIQFCRYAKFLKSVYGGKIYIETRPQLLRLLKTCDGLDGIIGYGDPIPEDVKYSQMLMSCPLICRHFSEEHFPSEKSYLKAQPNRIDSFKPFVDYFSPETKKVGFCWAGNAQLPSTDRRRSTNLSMWRPLAEIPGIGWISLQKGPPAVQLKQTPIGITAIDLMPQCDDMADTAAVIAHCDLVITVDTAIAHLSAALGKPTWVLSRRDACWRWLGDRTDNPWYPTVRHYRQKQFNNWPGLMKIVADDLHAWTTSQ